MSWTILLTAQAVKDLKKIDKSTLRPKANQLLAILEQDPLQDPPPFKYLIGDKKGYISRRLNIQHRLVYEVFESEKTIKIVSF